MPVPTARQAPPAQAGAAQSTTGQQAGDGNAFAGLLEALDAGATATAPAATSPATAPDMAASVAAGPQAALQPAIGDGLPSASLGAKSEAKVMPKTALPALPDAKAPDDKAAPDSADPATQGTSAPAAIIVPIDAASLGAQAAGSAPGGVAAAATPPASQPGRSASTKPASAPIGATEAAARKAAPSSHAAAGIHAAAAGQGTAAVDEDSSPQEIGTVRRQGIRQSLQGAAPIGSATGTVQGPGFAGAIVQSLAQQPANPETPATTAAPPVASTAAIEAPTAAPANRSSTPVPVPLAAAAAASPAADAPTAASAASGTPATRQVAAALVQIAHAPSGSSVTLRLDPAELGHVQVRIDRGVDGTATVTVAAERPETLRLLMADQPALHRTLDSAGLSQDARSLTFSLASADTGGNPTADRGSGGFAGNGGFGSSGGGGGQQGAPWRQDRSPYPDPTTGPSSSAVWLRAGVDITA